MRWFVHWVWDMIQSWYSGPDPQDLAWMLHASCYYISAVHSGFFGLGNECVCKKGALDGLWCCQCSLRRDFSWSLRKIQLSFGSKPVPLYSLLVRGQEKQVLSQNWSCYGRCQVCTVFVLQRCDKPLLFKLSSWLAHIDISVYIPVS